MSSKYYNRNFKPQYYYHVYNRGAYKHKIFKDKEDYETFTRVLAYFIKHPTAKMYSYLKRAQQPYVRVRNPNIHSVKLVAFCLMPNHFHLVVKQMPSADKKTGISNLMRRVTITYSMHFHYKYNHSGALFQGRYKNVTVDSNSQLLHLSRYIHQNPLPLLSRSKSLSDYPYSSYQDYLGNINRKWLKTSPILNQFKKNPVKQYQQFIQSKDKDTDLLENLSLD